MSGSFYRRKPSRKRWTANPANAIPFLGTILLTIVGAVSCDQDGGLTVDTSRLPDSTLPFREAIERGAKYVSTVTNSRGLPTRVQETILIASFNIQAFGESKMNDRWVMERLSEVIRRFDIVAIQEIRSKDQGLMPALMSYVNAAGGRYDFLLGPRLGDTSSKEQYAYVYDSTRIITGPDCTYTLNDDINVLHREPLIGRFWVRTNRTSQPWTFSLVNLHTDPDVAIQELEAMGGILASIRQFEATTAREDDVILLGDLNAGPDRLTSIRQRSGMQPVIVREATNVRGTEIYDNLVFDPSATSEYTANCGVLKLTEFFGISMQEALRLSDHNPVWAEFVVEERSSTNTPQFATQPFAAYR
jgi:deoxyribonuclease-1-like protein